MSWPKQRSWGWYATLIRTPWFCLKLLRFKPYGALSMQRHFDRTEEWFFVKGKGIVEYDVTGYSCGFINKDFFKWTIRPKQWHRFTAFDKPVYAIELQYGKKVIEDDIERK